MELDVAVSMAKPLQQEGFKLGTPVADDDAATIKRLREEIDVGIQKSGLICPMPKRPDPDVAETTHSELKEQKVFAHITKCLFYVIKYNNIEPRDIARSLMNTPRHFSVIVTPVVIGT